MSASAIACLGAGLAAGLGIVCYLIAADRARFLIRFEVQMWRKTYYLRALPNFLQALHDNHFKTAWPSQPNAVSAAYFRFRTRAFLKMRPRFLRAAFLQQHITLFALVQVLRPFLRDFIQSEQQRIAGERIINMEDTIERDRLIDFLDYVREERAAFHATLTTYDRATLIAMIDLRIVPTLRIAHAIFQEHGYCLMPELTQLRRWEEMTGSELSQDLPVMKRAARSRARAEARKAVARRK